MCSKNTDAVREVLETVNDKLFKGDFWSNHEMWYVSDRLTKNPLKYFPEIINHALLRPIERQIRERNVDTIFYNVNRAVVETIPASPKDEEKTMYFLVIPTLESDNLDAKHDGGFILFITYRSSIKMEGMTNPLNFESPRLHYIKPKVNRGPIKDNNKNKKVDAWSLADWENLNDDFEIITAEHTYSDNLDSYISEASQRLYTVTAGNGRFEGKKHMAFEFRNNGSRKIKLY